MVALRDYQDALESAIVRVSEARFAGIPEGSLALRIESALDELDKLRRDEIPDYASPDVALLYSHWYLPAQVNLAYSLGVDCLSKRSRNGQSGRPIQLVDLGAGTGAMALGILLAVADNLTPAQWPEMIAVYQIDSVAMLDLGDEIWQSLEAQVSASEALPDVADLMSRTMFERAEASPDGNGISAWTDAERWLTALHVVYEEKMGETKPAFAELQATVQPHCRIVTAPESKRERIVSPVRVDQLLQGKARAVSAHRNSLAQVLATHLGQKAKSYLTNEVQWATQSQSRMPVANMRVE